MFYRALIGVGGENAVTPATGQKEAVPQWYDVEVVKGTQYTVTGYSVGAEGSTAEGEQVGVWSSQVT